MGCAGGGSSAPPVEDKIPAVKFDKTRAWDHLTRQVAFGPRVPGTTAHSNCRDYLLAEFKKHTDNARLQEFKHTWSQDNRQYTMWNIIGEQNWQNATTRVTLYAHWDSRPTADQEFDEEKRAQPVPGANDGASGVAVLLELMRSLKEQNPKVGIQYVLTDGEDLGPFINEMLLGAAHFAKNPPDPKPDYGILLDMIGDKDLRVPMERNSYRYAPKLMDALYAHAKAVGLSKTFPAVPGETIVDDHMPLNEVGMPTIDLIDFTYEPWHTLEDTPDKCSPDSLLKVGALLETWLLKETPFKPAGKAR
ncbi:MAG TPA: M28 family peptidase [Fimbriimonas sp.]